MVREYTAYLEKETGRSRIRKVRTYPLDIGSIPCSSPSIIYNLLEGTVRLSTYAEERVYAVYLNTRNRLIGISLISQGTVNLSMVSPREVYLRALLLGATGVVLAHNHPSQDTTPSREDKETAKRLREAGELINLRFLDSIIVGDGYRSLRDDQVL